MPQVTRTHQAEEDLVEILTYLGQYSWQAAEQIADAIEQLCQQLAQFPLMGRSREDLAPGLRSFPVRRYVVYYRPTANGVEIIRVLHGSRNVEPSMFQP